MTEKSDAAPAKGAGESARRAHEHPHRDEAEAAVHTAPGRPAAVVMLSEAEGFTRGDVVRGPPGWRAEQVEKGHARPATDVDLGLASHRVLTVSED